MWTAKWALALNCRHQNLKIVHIGSILISLLLKFETESSLEGKQSPKCGPRARESLNIFPKHELSQFDDLVT